MLSKQSPHLIMQGLFTAAGAVSPEGEQVILTLPGWLRFQAAQMRPPHAVRGSNPLSGRERRSGLLT